MRSPNWSSKILKEETVTSTNDRLAELCQEKEIKEFTTLMAEYQTAGSVEIHGNQNMARI